LDSLSVTQKVGRLALSMALMLGFAWDAVLGSEQASLLARYLAAHWERSLELP
jgi:hypothetical protein